GFAGVSGRNIGFNLKVVEAKAPTMGGSGSGQVDINVYHGVTDAPAVDVYLNADNTPAISDLNYGNNTGYVKFPAQESIVTVTATGNPAVVAGKYLAPLHF